jgi:hypothetical protein
MRIIGCDLHAGQQTLAMLDTTTGEMVNLTLMHEGNKVREFYSQLARPVLVGIEATGSMHWFLNLMEELGIECRVGHPATIRAAGKRFIQVKKKMKEPLDYGRPRLRCGTKQELSRFFPSRLSASVRLTFPQWRPI